MNRLTMTCGSCGGTGTITTWNIVPEGCCRRFDSTCTDCNGKGYKEYVVFSVEEAEAILKHCGLKE